MIEVLGITGDRRPKGRLCILDLKEE